MIVDKDITELESSITGDQRKELIFLLLSGAKTSAAGQVYSFLGGVGLEPHRRYALITNLDILAQQQREDWFGGANTDRYAVLKRTTKEVVLSGPILDLLDADGQPDILQIRQAFSKGRGGNK